MWVSYHVGSAALILLLYAVKTVVLRFLRRSGSAGVVFAAAVACCVPVTWALTGTTAMCCGSLSTSAVRSQP